MKYTQHPLSAAFPAMSADDLEALTNDIATHGQREPGVLYEGQVLDGWHRYQACEWAGTEFVAVEFTGTDPVAFVISRNAHRRHLTASQRAAAVVMCAEWVKNGTNQHTKRGDEAASPPPKSNKELAAAAGTTVRTVQQAKRAVEAGLGDAVRDGQMSAETAVAVAKGEPPKAKARQEAPAEPEPDELEMLKQHNEELRAMNREQATLLESCEADDTGAELVKQAKLAAHYLREVNAERDKNVRLIKERDQLSRWQGDIIRATGAESPKAALLEIRKAFASATA